MIEKPDYSDLFIQMLLTCLLLQDEIDTLAGTNVYRHEMKQLAGRMGKELDKIINTEVGKIWGIDDECLFAQIEYKKALLKMVVGFKAEENGIIAEIIRTYYDHPEATLKALKIEIVDRLPKV